MSELIAFFNNLSSFFTETLEESRSLYPGNTLPRRQAVLVHSALSAFGTVPGGEETVLDALEAVRRKRRLTIVMPAHQDDPERGTELGDGRSATNGAENGHCGKIGGEYRYVDPRRQPCIGMGRIAEGFRKSRGVRRSEHPQLSFCAKGPLAREITEGHRCAAGLGPASPLGELYRLDALVLMLGTGWETCTAMHLAEYEAVRKLEEAGGQADRVTCRARSGRNGEWRIWEDLAYRADRFPEIGEAFERERPESIRTGPLGEAGRVWKLFRVRDIVDFSIDRCGVLR